MIKLKKLLVETGVLNENNTEYFNVKNFSNYSPDDRERIINRIGELQWDAIRRFYQAHDSWHAENDPKTFKRNLESKYKYSFTKGDNFSSEAEAELAFELLKEMIPQKNIGPTLYKFFKDLPKLIAVADTDTANVRKRLKDDGMLSYKTRDVENIKRAIGNNAFKELIGKSGNRTGPVEMILMVSHIKDGMARLPKKLLNALPNKTQIDQLIKKINAGDTDLDPGDPLLYQYDELLEKGVRDLMKKLGVTLQKDDINLEDDNMTVYTTIDASKMKPLKKLGFEEDE
jgi:ribosome assembly protein YihI (activator of Der GTPase)